MAFAVAISVDPEILVVDEVCYPLAMNLFSVNTFLALMPFTITAT